MSKTLQAIRGLHDILPHQTPGWQYLEVVVREVLSAYGYEEIRLPLLESTELFQRTIGEVTDIVEKEMYTFEDRNGDSLTLRPEGTAGCVRAGIEHGLLYNQVRRMWYVGPMFRHERPQQGRYRQFHQIGVEAFGMAGPELDAELILMTARMWRQMGIEGLQLQINSLGTPETRAAYREALVAYMSAHHEQLDEDSRRRLLTNPLRILDSKNPAMQSVINGAPHLSDWLDADARRHFTALTTILDRAGMPYMVNPRLVRGLDYYTHTVFEWVTARLGAQGTVCAGGRYDGLVARLGGKATPAAGFAMGMERLVMLLEEGGHLPLPPTPELYLAMVGERAEQEGLLLAERLRDARPGLRLIVGCGGGGFKSQLKRADKSGARYALILGEEECAQGKVALKVLRGEAQQLIFTEQELLAYLNLHMNS